MLSVLRLRRRRLIPIATGCISWLRRVVVGITIGLRLPSMILRAQDKLGCNRRIEVLVLIIPGAQAAGSVEHLQGNLAVTVSTHVKLHNGMDPLGHLSLEHRRPRKTGVQEHDVHFETTLQEGPLHPVNKVPPNLLEEKKLNIGHLVAVSARNFESVIIAARGTRATLPIRILLPSVSWWRSRAASVLAV